MSVAAFPTKSDQLLETETLTIHEFLLQKGRLPHLTDEVKPWRYLGWLVPYLQRCETLPGIARRYDYVWRTIENGSLLDEPIPVIEFCSEFEPAVKPGLQMLEKLLDYLSRETGNDNSMRDFCEWLGFALGVFQKESNLSVAVQEILYRNFNFQLLLQFPTDYFGQLLAESQYGKRRGFYPTPMDLCQLNWQLISRFETKDIRHRSAYDPTVGTGRKLLVASNQCLQLYGQDVDYLCWLITKINLALYAPWFLIPKSYFRS